MKKGSSKHKKQQQPQPQKRQYPTKDNVYSFPPPNQGQSRQGQQRPGQSYPVAPRQEMRPPAPQKKRKRKANYLVLPMFVFIVIAIYLFGQMITMGMKKSDIEVETVSMGTIQTPANYTGLIVREEYVATGDRAGQPFYQYTENDYVTKNAVICQIKNTSSTDIIEDKLDELDKDILRSQKERADISAFSEDISRIEGNIKKAVDSYSSRSMRTDMSYLYTMKTQVTQSMTQRNQIWLTENVESLSQLTAEKGIYEQQLADSVSAIRAIGSGVLSFTYDGLEETLTPDTLGDITQAQIKGKGEMTYLSKAGSVEVGDPLFRVVESNRWYVVTYLPNTAVVNWDKGDAIGLNMQTEEDTIKILAKIQSIDIGEKEAKVVFSSMEQMDEFIDARTVTFQLGDAAVEGLKVPNNAIVEKSLYRVPKECIVKSGGKNGVLLVSGEKDKFISVSIVTSDAENYYIDKNSDLSLGDVILQGIGEEATQYTISELDSRPGVYIANSSIAKFVIVTIIDQNQEYAIINAGSIYGLQIYDTIVSDAKNITEGQNIY